MTKYEDYERVAREINDIDISMLFLNAGWTLMGHFKELTPEEIE